MPLITWPSREELAAALVAAGLVALGGFAWYRQAGADDSACCARTATFALTEAMPVADHLRHGTLDNGLQYFVRRNSSPKRRAELRLAVNVGSVLEHSAQRGIAHAVEHMLFRGTRRFPRCTVSEYLQATGMRSGGDINARTTTDETVYTFTVPTDRIGVVDTALAILADMAHEATFDAAETRTETGIVLEEWRSRSDASNRLTDQRDGVVLAGSLYAKRSPIGDTAAIRGFSANALRSFYGTWYRPELMSIVAVGDFDADSVETFVKRHFGAMPASAEQLARPTIEVPRDRTLRGAVLSDPEASETVVSVWLPKPAQTRTKVQDYRAEIIARLWRDILNERLEDASDEPGSPLLYAEAELYTLARPVEAEHISAGVADGRVLEATEQLVAEIARLARHGPTATELKRSGDAMIREAEQADQYLDDSDDLAEGYVTQALEGTMPVDYDSAYDLERDIVPTLRIADLIAYARRVSVDSGGAIIATMAHGAQKDAVLAASLIERARAGMTSARGRSYARNDSITLIEHPPVPGKIASEKSSNETNVYDWTLSNGARVILKPTSFSYDDVDIRLFAPGGASLASDADYPSAYRSDAVIRATGIGPVRGNKLARMLDASSIELTHAVMDDGIEFRGSSSPRDLDKLFQVLHLYLTAPRRDSVAFRRYRERSLAATENRDADPDAVFRDSVTATVTQHNPRSVHTGKRFAESVSMEKALSFWNARLSNASGFTLVVAGDFTVARMRPLVERYLAPLPAGVHEVARDNGAHFPAGVVRRTIIAGIGPRARTQITMSGPYVTSVEAGEALTAAQDVAELALEERLRETLGGTYGVSVTGGVNVTLSPRYRMSVSFEAAPERIDSLAAIALAELKRLQVDGPTQAELATTRAALTRDLDNKLESNNYWVDELLWHSRMNWPLESIAKHQGTARSLSMKTLREACAKYLDATSYVRVTMLPRVVVKQDITGVR